MPSPLQQPGTIPFADRLSTHGDSLAVATDSQELTYAQLADRVADVASRLGGGRRLVGLTVANNVDSLVAYLATIGSGHVALMLPPDSPASRNAIQRAYRPDLLLDTTADELAIEQLNEDPAHNLHPDLALLLSTSGSTGSPKLVRLSHNNLQANAAAIAQYMALTPGDRAITSLPMHYCYGLSVINSHLAVGGGLVLTGLSVVDGCFWDLFRAHEVTSLAGVPYTFELLDRRGFEAMELPSLRRVTQAGGRLDAADVRRYSALGERDGWDFFVMYGQTEATARMAYLPPALAGLHPHAIGIPLPGGSFSIEHFDEAEPGTGELVYSGPNVMLGYAERSQDLALGRTVTKLRTGDLARRDTDGLYEITGRRSRFVKSFGVRVDLDRAEALLAEAGVAARCVGDDDRLVVVVEGSATADVRTIASRELSVPATALRLHSIAEMPRLASGKPDYASLLDAVRNGEAPEAGTRCEIADPDVNVGASIRSLFAEMFEREDIGEGETFVSLGGDSLSYVEMSVGLEELLGHLPPDWHVTPVGELALRANSRSEGRRRGTQIETSVLLRAVAILMIVSSHAGLIKVLGCAHALLAVAGFNFARFMLGPEPPARRLRRQMRSVARIVVPSVAFIAVATIFLTHNYTIANVFLLNGLLGPETWTHQWNFWFIESLVYMLVVCCATLAIPRVASAERRRPFEFAVVVLAIGVSLRFGLFELGAPNTRPVLWLFALGWAVARSESHWHRALVSAVALLAVPGFFGDPAREAVIAGGVLLLAWVPAIRIPAVVARAATLVAAASLYIYLTHWQLFPQFESPAVGVIASLAGGIAYWRFVGTCPAIMQSLRMGLVGRRNSSPALATEPAL